MPPWLRFAALLCALAGMTQGQQAVDPPDQGRRNHFYLHTWLSEYASSLAARKFYGHGYTCAIGRAGRSIFCWLPGNLNPLETDATWSLDMPLGSSADGVPVGNIFRQVQVTQDVWALTDTGNIVVVLNGGGLLPNATMSWCCNPSSGMTSLHAPYQPSFVGQFPPGTRQRPIGVIWGPFLAMDIHPDVNYRPAAWTDTFVSYTFASERIVAALTTDGNPTFFTLRSNTPVNNVTADQHPVHGWYNLERVLRPANGAANLCSLADGAAEGWRGCRPISGPYEGWLWRTTPANRWLDRTEPPPIPVPITFTNPSVQGIGWDSTNHMCLFTRSSSACWGQWRTISSSVSSSRVPGASGYQDAVTNLFSIRARQRAWTMDVRVFNDTTLPNQNQWRTRPYMYEVGVSTDPSSAGFANGATRLQALEYDSLSVNAHNFPWVRSAGGFGLTTHPNFGGNTNRMVASAVLGTARGIACFLMTTNAAVACINRLHPALDDAVQSSMPAPVMNIAAGGWLANSSLARDRSPSWLAPWTNPTGRNFIALTGSDSIVCALRADGIPSCLVDDGSGTIDAGRPESYPVFPSFPIVPVHVMRMRGADVLCVHLAADSAFNMTASQVRSQSNSTWRYEVSCYGRQHPGQFMLPSSLALLDTVVKMSDGSDGGADGFCAVPGGGRTGYNCWGSRLATWSGLDAGITWSALSVGLRFQCGIRSSDGAGVCAGVGISPYTAQAPAATTVMRAVAAADAFACFVQTADSILYCYGDVATLRTSALADATLSVTGGVGANFVTISPPAGGSWSMLTAGSDYICAAYNAARQFKCLGASAAGQLAVPTTAGNPRSYRQLSAGHQHVCGVLATGDLVDCWGANAAGQVAMPMEAATATFQSVHALRESTCGVLTSGLITCWGALANYTTFGPIVDQRVHSSAAMNASRTFTVNRNVGDADGTCATSRACATLAGAVAACPGFACQILVFGQSSTAPVFVRPFQAGMQIQGVRQGDGTFASVSFSATAQDPTRLFRIHADSVGLYNLTLTHANPVLPPVYTNLLGDGSVGPTTTIAANPASTATANCDTAVTIRGRLTVVSNIILRGFWCTRYVWEHYWTWATPEHDQFSSMDASNPIRDAEYDNITFVNTQAPIQMHVERLMTVMLRSVTANYAFRHMWYSSFLRVWNSYAYTLERFRLSGFTGPAPNWTLPGTSACVTGYSLLRPTTFPCPELQAVVPRCGRVGPQWCEASEATFWTLPSPGITIVWLLSRGGGRADIRDNVFEDMIGIGSRGGAIQVHNRDMGIDYFYDRNTFRNCIAGGDGGAINVERLTANSHSQNFLSQNAFTSCRSVWGRGGAAYLRAINSGQNWLQWNVASSCSAALDGGAFYLSGGTNQLSDTTCSQSSAGRNGGTLYSQSFSLILTNTAISGSIAGGDGGGVYATSVDSNGDAGFRPYASPFSGSVANSVQIVANGRSIQDCTAGGSGGAIWVHGYHEFVIGGNMIIRRTVARVHGGAIRAAGVILLRNVGSSTFYATQAITGDGGAIACFNCRYLSLPSSLGDASSPATFSNTSAGGFGGAVAFTYAYSWLEPVNSGGLVMDNNVRLQFVTFSNTTAGMDGGAVSVRGWQIGGAATVGLIQSSSFTRCSAGGLGGALAWDAGQASINQVDVQVVSSQFTACTALQGAAINTQIQAVWQTQPSFTVASCTFTGNRARMDGGALAVFNQKVAVTQSMFDENAGNGGGAIFHMGCGPFSLERSFFRRNAAVNRDGGAIAGYSCAFSGMIFTYSPPATLLTDPNNTETWLTSPSVVPAGDLNALTTTPWIVQDVCSSVVGRNVGTWTCPAGGVIASVRSAHYGIVTGNCGTGWQQGVCGLANLTALRAWVGRICIGNPSCQLNGTTLGTDPCFNTTGTVRLAVTLRCIRRSATPLIVPAAVDALGSIFLENSARSDGGAVSLTACPLNLNFASFLGNSASGSGGAVAVALSSDSAPAQISTTVFINNTAQDSAGAVFFKSAGFPIRLGSLPFVLPSVTGLSPDPFTPPTAYNDLQQGLWMIRAAQVGLRYLTGRVNSSLVDVDRVERTFGANGTLINVLEDARNLTTMLLEAPQASFAIPADPPAAGSFAWVPPALMFRGVTSAVASPFHATSNVTLPGRFTLTINTPFDFGQRRVAMLMVSNTARRGVGGDVLLTQLSGFTASLSMSNVLSLNATAARSGGSLYVEDITAVQVGPNAVFNGSATRAVGSTGGAVAIGSTPSVTLTDVALANCLSHRGGGLWLSRQMDTEVEEDILTAADADALSLANVTYDNNRGVWAGGDLYVDLGSVPACTACASTNRSSAGLYGVSTATSTRTLTALASQYEDTVAASWNPNVNITALVIVGAVPVGGVLWRLQATDALGQWVAFDNFTVCRHTAMRNDTGQLAALGFEPVYSSVHGIVPTFPFVLNVGPGVPGLLTAECETENRKLPRASVPLFTDSVRIAFSANTLANTIYLLPSSGRNPRPAERILEVQVVDNSGQPVPLQVNCGYTVERAFNALGQSITATAIGTTSRTTTLGTAAFFPALQADSNSTIQISASCTWTTGDLIRSASSLTMRTYALQVAWGPYGPWYNCSAPTAPASSCVADGALAPLGAPALSSLYTLSISNRSLLFAPSTNASTWTASTLWQTFTLSDVLSCMLHLPMVQSLPSPTEIANIQPLSPAPSVTVMVDRQDTGARQEIMRIEPASCTIAVDNEWATLQNAAAGRAVYSTDAVLVGTATATTVDGVATFSRVGLRSVGFGLLVPMQASCNWPTGERLVSSRQVVAMQNVVLSFTRQPPVIVLPSGVTESTQVLLRPAPVVQIQRLGFNGTLSPLSGYSLPCSVRMTVLRAGDGSTPAVLVGTIDGVLSDANTGQVTFDKLGVSTNPGAVVQLTVTCAWLSRDTASVTSANITVSPLEIRFTTQPVTPVLSSGTDAATLIPFARHPSGLLPGGAPTVQLLALDTTSSTVSSAAMVPLRGFGGLQVRVLVTSVSTPPGSAAPIAVGTAVVNTDVNGTAAFSSLGVSGSFNSILRITVVLTWLSGADVTNQSWPVLLTPLYVHWNTAPQGMLLASGRTAATLVTMSPAPRISIVYPVPPVPAPWAGKDSYGLQGTANITVGTHVIQVQGFALPCSVSSLTAGTQVVGTSVLTSAVDGFTLADRLGVSGAPGTATSLSVSCTWISGTTVSGTSDTVLLSPLYIYWNVSVPPSSLVSGSSASANIPLSPSPVFGLVYPLGSVTAPSDGMDAFGRRNTTAAMVLGRDFAAVTGYSVPCTVSTSSLGANVVGSVAYTTEASSGWAFMDNTGLSGVLGTQMDITVRCTWVSGSVIAGTSDSILLSPLRLNLVTPPPTRVLASGTTPASRVMFTVVVQAEWFQVRVPASPTAVADFRVGTYAALSGFSVPCSVQAETADNAGGQAVQAGGTLDGATAADGRLTFNQLALSGNLDAVARIVVRCTWLSNAVVSVSSANITLAPITLAFAQQPQLVLLPSAASDTGLIAMSPAPAVQASWIPPEGSSAPLAGYPLRCGASVVTVTNAGSTALTLTGDSVAFLDVATATVSFIRLGVFGSFGSGLRLSVSCTWLNQNEVGVLSAPFILSNVSVVVTQQPPALTYPSNPNSPAPLSPPPTLTLVSTTAGGGTSTLLGFVVACTVALVDVVLPANATSGVQLLGDIASTVEPSSGKVTFGNIAFAGPGGARFRLRFTCAWVSGQSMVQLSDPVEFPLPTVTWLTAPDPYTLYNTERPEPLQAVLGFLSSNSTGGEPPSRNWRSVGVRVGEMRCAVSSIAARDGSTVLVSGTTVVSPDIGDGLASFVHVALLPPAAAPGDTSDQVLELIVSCTIRGLGVAPLTGRTIIQQLRTAWSQNLPATVLPASNSDPNPFLPPPSVQLVNHTGGLLRESGVVCAVTISGTLFPPLADPRAQLLGSTRANTIDGVATFFGLSINTVFGARIELTVTCTRNQGGFVEPIKGTTDVDMMKVFWRPQPDPVLLQNTLTPVSAYLLRYTANTSNAWLPLPGTERGVVGVDCTLRVVSGTGAPIGLASRGQDANRRSDVNSTVNFNLAIQGTPGGFGTVFVDCAIADLTFSSDPSPVSLELARPLWVRPPPRVWIPSSGVALTAIQPFPMILLRRTSSGAPVDARGAVCRTGVSPLGAAEIVAPPVEGYSMRISVQDSVVGTDGAQYSVEDEQRVYQYSITTPIEMPGVMLRGEWNAAFNLTVTCLRSQGDNSYTLHWPMRIVDGDFRWSARPPATSVSQRSFSATVVLVDKEVERASLLALGTSSWMTQQAIELGATNNTQADELLFTPSVMYLDNVTTCFMNLDSRDPRLIIQNNDAQSSLGAVTFRGTSLTARLGTTVSGTVTCSLGEIRYPGTLTWRIGMEPCDVGFAPTGDGGYTCAVCGAGFYSDGGPGAQCVRCPSQGATCSAGRITFLDRFMRIQDGSTTVSELTELRPCYFPTGCIVATNTMNRSASETHKCANGYTGPMCGICDADREFAKSGSRCTPCPDRGWSYFVTALVPAAFIAFSVWISLFREQTKSSETSVVTRMLITYIQVLGALGSLYVARGTTIFREVFGFSDVLGDSVLSLPPLQCILRLPYEFRFAVTISIPFTVAFMSIVVNLCWIPWKVRRDRRHKEIANAIHLGRKPDAPTSLTFHQRVGRLLCPCLVKKRPGAKKGFMVKTTALVHSTGYLEQVRGEARAYFAQQGYLAPIIFVLGLGYTTLTTNSFSQFDCFSYSFGGKVYLSRDVSIVCYEGMHNLLRLVAGFAIFAFGGGLPALFAYILWRSKGTLKSKATFSRFGQLYDGYSIDRGLFWWESLAMMRKAAVVFIGSVVKDPYQQIIFSIALMVLSLALQSANNPYISRKLNRMETISIMGILGTQLISLLYLRADAMTSDCIKLDPSAVVDDQGTTCQTLLDRKANQEYAITSVLVIINLVIVGGFASILFRSCYREARAYVLESLRDEQSVVSKMHRTLSRVNTFRDFLPATPRKDGKTASDDYSDTSSETDELDAGGPAKAVTEAEMKSWAGSPPVLIGSDKKKSSTTMKNFLLQAKAIGNAENGAKKGKDASKAAPSVPASPRHASVMGVIPTNLPGLPRPMSKPGQAQDSSQPAFFKNPLHAVAASQAAQKAASSSSSSSASLHVLSHRQRTFGMMQSFRFAPSGGTQSFEPTPMSHNEKAGGQVLKMRKSTGQMSAVAEHSEDEEKEGEAEEQEVQSLERSDDELDSEDESPVSAHAKPAGAPPVPEITTLRGAVPSSAYLAVGTSSSLSGSNKNGGGGSSPRRGPVKGELDTLVRLIEDLRGEISTLETGRRVSHAGGQHKEDGAHGSHGDDSKEEEAVPEEDKFDTGGDEIPVGVLPEKTLRKHKALLHAIDTELDSLTTKVQDATAAIGKLDATLTERHGAEWVNALGSEKEKSLIERVRRKENLAGKGVGSHGSEEGHAQHGLLSSIGKSLAKIKVTISDAAHGASHGHGGVGTARSGMASMFKSGRWDLDEPEHPAPTLRPARIPAYGAPQQGGLDQDADTLGWSSSSLVSGASTTGATVGSAGTGQPATLSFVRSSPATKRALFAASSAGSSKRLNAPVAAASGAGQANRGHTMTGAGIFGSNRSNATKMSMMRDGGHRTASVNSLMSSGRWDIEEEAGRAAPAQQEVKAAAAQQLVRKAVGLERTSSVLSAPSQASDGDTWAAGGSERSLPAVSELGTEQGTELGTELGTVAGTTVTAPARSTVPSMVSTVSSVPSVEDRKAAIAAAIARAKAHNMR